MPHAGVGDVDIHYETRGSGPALVLIPGTGQTIADLEPLIDALCPDFRVVAADNRGAGGSSAPRGPYSIEAMAADVCGVLDALGIARAHVLGISMGGRIALALTLAHPERLDRLVLVSTSARVAKGRWKVRLGLELARLLGPPQSRRQPAHAVRAQFNASSRFDCSARLGEINRPALVVHGRADELVPLALSQELQHAIAGSQFAEFDGGHAVSVAPESRDAVVTAVRAFLR